MSVTAQPLIISKYASNSITTEYTAPASTRAIIDKFTVTNISGGAVALTVYLVPSGGSAGDSNKIISAQSIAAGATVDLSALQNHILATGDFVAVLAVSSSTLVIRMSGRQVT